MNHFEKNIIPKFYHLLSQIHSNSRQILFSIFLNKVFLKIRFNNEKVSIFISLIYDLENRAGSNVQLSNIDRSRGRSRQCALRERYTHSSVGGRDPAIE